MSAASHRWSIVALLLLAAPLDAQDLCRDRKAQPSTAGAALVTLRALDSAGCLGGNICPSEVAVCEQFDDWKSEKDAEGALELLMGIRNSAAAAGESENLRHLVRRVDAWIVVVGNDAIARMQPAQWQWDTGGGGFFLDTTDAIPIDETLEQDCAAGLDRCARAFAEAVEIMTDTTVVRRMNGVLLLPEREALVTYVQALDQRWDDYFNRSPSQFPWELAVNSAIYRRHERRGFNEPPASQWIVLHPAAAYEYASSAEDRFASALALELIGWFRGHVGGSLALALADRSDVDALGYGVAFHWENKATLGVIHHGNSDGVSVLLSPNLEKFVATNAKRVRDVLTKVRILR